MAGFLTGGLCIADNEILLARLDVSEVEIVHEFIECPMHREPPFDE
jgi:hypothetical protein